MSMTTLRRPAPSPPPPPSPRPGPGRPRPPASGGTAPAATALDAYLGQIPGGPLLTAPEERELARGIAAGDAEARARLIRGNLRLVVRIARDYQGRGLPLDDLVGEGNLGLIRAAGDFDPAFGTRFSTYAAHWIKQAIRHALMTTGPTIRLPSHVVNLLTRWRRAERTLRRRLDRDPGFDEVADALGLNDSHRALVARALQARRLVAEGPAHDPAPGDRVLAAGADPAAALEAADERRALLERLDRLDDRERTVLRLRFGIGGAEPLTLREVGRRLGITREWARKLEQRAVRKLGDGDCHGKSAREPAAAVGA